MLIAPVGMYIRRHLEESLHISPAEAAAPRESSLKIVCTQHGKTVLAAILTLVGGTTAAYVVTFYMPTYAVRELGFTPSVALFGAALTGLISFAFAPFVGKLSDVVGRKPLILWSRIALAVLIYPGFLWLNASPTPTVLFVVLGVFSFGLVVQTVPGITMLPEMFPKAVRASGMSVRDTSQPSGAATRQQIALTEQAMIRVVTSGSTKVGSVNSVAKLASVKPPSFEGGDA
eukprot:gene45031-60120_t